MILFSFSPQNLNVYSEISTKNNNSNNISTNGNNSILFLTQPDSQVRNMEKTSLEDKDLLNNNRESAVEDSTIDSNNASISKFQQEFCGLDSKANSNIYVKEYILPQTCEMPLGIAVDSDGKKVWYVSTKKGTLGNYDIKEKNLIKSTPSQNGVHVWTLIVFLRFGT